MGASMMQVKFLLCMFFISYLPSSSCQKPDLSPKPWPEQFHAQIYQDLNGSLSIVDLWYDWPNGRNLIIIQLQLGYKMYDVEWTNGTSYFYNLEANSCRTLHFPVGILRPDWLDHSSYLGVKEIDGFSCNVWEKVDFITYYEDVETQRPVAWYFQWTGQFMHIISFEVGATLPDAFWQAPSYCFSGTTPSKSHGPTLLLNGAGADEEPWKDSWKGLLSGTFRDT